MKRALMAVALLLGSAGFSQAALIGFFNTNAGADAGTATAITAAGHTPVDLNNLTPVDLAGLDVVWVLNGNNGPPPAVILANVLSLNAFVAGGGILSFHDRNVNQGLSAATYIPGAAGTTFVNNFGTDLDILNNTTLVTNGPGGVVTNTNLDGGNFSNHGFATAGTLPAGAVGILSEGGAPGNVVDFFYPFGAGFVYYSTIPMDFYFAGGGINPPADQFRQIYGPNEAAFQASLQQEAVPEPASVTLLVIGTLGLCGYGWRRRKAAA